MAAAGERKLLSVSRLKSQIHQTRSRVALTLASRQQGVDRAAAQDDAQHVDTRGWEVQEVASEAHRRGG